MTSKIFLLILIIVTRFGAGPVRADSPVWRIDKGGNHLFIGGTIHLLSASDYPLPSAFQRTYKQAAKIVLEADIQKMQRPDYQQNLLRQLSYLHGQKLTEVLSPATFQSLQSYCASNGIALEAMLGFKPGMIVMVLTLSELKRLGQTGTGVDEFFLKMAVKDQKPLGYLETVEQQLAFISDMGAGQEDDLIRYTLDEMEQLPGMLQSIKTAWRQGDLDQLEKISATPFKQEFPAIHDAILDARNNDWMPQIESMFLSREVEFILVGALHLAGESGLIAQLQQRGYRVKKLE